VWLCINKGRGGCDLKGAEELLTAIKKYARRRAGKR